MTAEQTTRQRDFAWPADTIAVATLVGERLGVNWTQVGPIIAYLKSMGLAVPGKTLYRGRPRDAWTEQDMELFEAGARFLKDQGKLLMQRTHTTNEELVAHIKEAVIDARKRG